MFLIMKEYIQTLTQVDMEEEVLSCFCFMLYNFGLFEYLCIFTHTVVWAGN